MKRFALELDHYTDADGGLAVAKIREPDTAGSPAIGVCGREVVCPGRCAASAGVLRGCAIISARRRNAASPRPIGNIGVAIPGFRPPGDVLFGDRKSTRLNSSHLG